MEPYLQKMDSPEEPEKFTPAFLRVYGAQNIINLQALEFTTQNQLLKSL